MEKKNEGISTKLEEVKANMPGKLQLMKTNKWHKK